ncbi:hypothetical protein WK13_34960 [Burkholderia ubonensis]|nr:hypothetical protein WK13_34960 [Burkholderia ubonensis]
MDRLEKTAYWRKSHMFTDHRWCGGIDWPYARRVLHRMQQDCVRGKLNAQQKEFMLALEETLIDRFYQ